MFIRANLRGKGESWDLDSGSKTPLTTFRPYDNGVKVWGRRFTLRPAAHTGSVRWDRGLLGGSRRKAQSRVAPRPPGPPPAAPAGGASPHRAPRRGSWLSASRSEALRPARAQRGEDWKPPRRLAAFVSMATVAARGGRREWAGPRRGAGSGRARGWTRGRACCWAGGWEGRSGVAAWASGLEVGVRGWG